MALPLIALPAMSAGFSALLGRILTWFFMTQLASVVVRMFATLGIAFATNEWLIEPLVDHVTNAWGAIPPELALWLSALGINEVVSIMLSAYGILGVKQIFLSRTGS